MATEHPAVTNFREYIRIKSVPPNPDYDGCVKWLKKQAEEVDGKFSITECVPGKPNVVITIEGANPDLPSILLNSHMDVVPVFPEHWKYEPFSAFKDESGNIYGRGTQDMKCVAVMYLEAIKILKKQNKILSRTIHLSFVPDEEIGGWDGMGKFVETETFKRLNVGFALDEGIASPEDHFLVYYGQRYPLRVIIKCEGQPGHGSQFLTNTAGEKMEKIMSLFYQFRRDEERKLKENPDLKLGDVTTINLTIINGGVQFNVVPAELELKFDVRVSPTIKLDDMLKKIQSWCDLAGEGVSFTQAEGVIVTDQMTCIEDGESVWWDAFSSAFKSQSAVFKTEIFPASTDLKFIRKMGIPALGFSPINNTEVLLHHHNEYLNEKVLLRGIEIYVDIISNLANVKE